MVPATALVSTIGVIAVPVQMVCVAGVAIAFGVGFTVMVNVAGVPTQAPKAGVTVIVATTGAVPVFTAVKDAILPVPLAAKPMEGVLLVQLNVVPGTEPVKVTAAVAVLLHTVWLAGCVTVGAPVVTLILSRKILLPYALVLRNATLTWENGAAQMFTETVCRTQSPAAGVV